MNGLEVMDFGREAVWVTLKVGGPLLIVAFVVGTVISLFQALTQIQEMTITLVPKIIALFAVLLWMAPFVGATMQTFAESIFDRIVSVGQDGAGDLGPAGSAAGEG